MSPLRTPGLALITGASSGIGASYAKRLAQRGFDLLLTARTSTRLHTLAAQLRTAHGVNIEVLPADLTLAADIARLAQRLNDDPAISLLVNNAGMAVIGPLVGAEPSRLARPGGEGSAQGRGFGGLAARWRTARDAARHAAG